MVIAARCLGLVAASPCVGETDIGPRAKGERSMFVEIAIIEPPELRAARPHKKIETAAIGQLIVLRLWLGVGDGGGEMSARGVSSL